MRALFIPHLPNRSFFEISDKKQLHYLGKVLRVREKEKLILFDGSGLYQKAQVTQLEKKQITLEVKNQKTYKPPHQISLGLALLKKEALEQSLNTAVQLGVSEILLFKADYSQNLHSYKKERVQKILISAMEQSNHFIFPQIFVYESLASLYEAQKNKKSFMAFTLGLKNSTTTLSNKPLCYLIGPEGGFSEREHLFLSQKSVKFFQLPTSILRAPIAVSCAMGYILKKIEG